jgi:hypothetical protein
MKNIEKYSLKASAVNYHSPFVLQSESVIHKSGIESHTTANILTTTASLSSGNVYDSNNLVPKSIQAKEFNFKNPNNNSNDSNNNSLVRESGASPSI